MDVYREIVEPEKNFLKVALFVSFFPQIIQGPIAIYDKMCIRDRTTDPNAAGQTQGTQPQPTDQNAAGQAQGAQTQ